MARIAWRPVRIWAFGQVSGPFGISDSYSTSLVPCNFHSVRMHAQAMSCPMFLPGNVIDTDISARFMHDQLFHARPLISCIAHGTLLCPGMHFSSSHIVSCLCALAISVSWYASAEQ